VSGRGSKLNGIAAVTFDFGNTLVRVDRAGLRRALELTAERVAHRLAVDRERFLEVWAQERDRQFAEEVPEFREVDLEQRSLRVLARLRGMPVPDRSVRWDDEAAAAYSEDAERSLLVDAYSDAFIESIPASPDILPILEGLATRFRLGVLTNWPHAATVDRYLEAAGWTRHLPIVVVSQRVGTIKPRPEIFRAAEVALGQQPAAILHVGDDWAADVVGARRAGWHAAYLRDRQGDTPLPVSEPDRSVVADLEIDRLVDLPQLLPGAGG
jgi:HAD superfamily hydrolase (TIGR01509 family)